MIFELSELIDDRNRAMYDSVASRISVQLSPSDDEYWGAITRDGVGHISYAPTEFPISCFTHELLHIKFDLEGKIRPGYQHWARDQDEWDKIDGIVEELLPFAYNQLMHHKMFPVFLSLGFPASEFLRSDDAHYSQQQIARDVQRLKNKKKDFPHGLPPLMYIYPFLAANSPDDTSAASADALKQMRNLSGGSFYSLTNLLKAWNNDPDPDVRRYMAHLFCLCDIPEIGFGPDEQNLIWAKDITQL